MNQSSPRHRDTTTELENSRSWLSWMFVNFVESLGSLRLALILLASLALLTLIGAWVPQSGQVDEATLLERFGKDGLRLLNTFGLTNLFCSPAYIACLTLIFVNLLACTALRMVPRFKKHFIEQDFLDGWQIKEQCHHVIYQLADSSTEGTKQLVSEMSRCGFRTRQSANRFIFDKGKIGHLAAPITHFGLFLLLIGVIVTALTSYKGTIYLKPGDLLPFPGTAASRPLIGKIPHWTVELTDSHRDLYKSGAARQWYSTVNLRDTNGHKLGAGTISVNTPLSVAGVDLNQADWALDSARLSVDGHSLNVPLKEMGTESMGVLPIAPGFLMILAVAGPETPMRIYFKHEGHATPRLVAVLNCGSSTKLGDVTMTNSGVTVRTGLQFKHDPGLPIVYLSFLFFVLGAALVAIPSYTVFAAIITTPGNNLQVVLGSRKGKFASCIKRELNRLAGKLGDINNQKVSVCDS